MYPLLINKRDFKINYFYIIAFSYLKTSFNCSQLRLISIKKKLSIELTLCYTTLFKSVDLYQGSSLLGGKHGSSIRWLDKCSGI